MGKEAKTNAMRILEREKVPYTAHEYAHEEGVAVAGVDVAGSMGEDPACVYKTLVTQGSSKNYFVFVIPVAAELELKAAARTGLRVCLRRTHRHPGVLCSGGPYSRRPGHHGKDHLLNRAEKYVFWDKDGWKILRKIYSNHKSYLKRKTMAKLHKTFESFLAHGNTRENLPQHSLQSHYFAVNCM